MKKATLNEPHFEEVTVLNDAYRVTLEHIGEGYNGDFEPEDPTDKQLIRFICERKEAGEWVVMDLACFCTMLTTETPRHILNHFAGLILSVLGTENQKSDLAKLTWYTPEN